MERQFTYEKIDDRNVRLTVTLRAVSVQSVTTFEKQLEEIDARLRDVRQSKPEAVPILERFKSEVLAHLDGAAAVGVTPEAEP